MGRPPGLKSHQGLSSGDALGTGDPQRPRVLGCGRGTGSCSQALIREEYLVFPIIPAGIKLKSGPKAQPGECEQLAKETRPAQRLVCSTGSVCRKAGGGGAHPCTPRHPPSSAPLSGRVPGKPPSGPVTGTSAREAAGGQSSGSHPDSAAVAGPFAQGPLVIVGGIEAAQFRGWEHGQWSQCTQT